MTEKIELTWTFGEDLSKWLVMKDRDTGYWQALKPVPSTHMGGRYSTFDEALDHVRERI